MVAGQCLQRYPLLPSTGALGTSMFGDLGARRIFGPRLWAQRNGVSSAVPTVN